MKLILVAIVALAFSVGVMAQDNAAPGSAPAVEQAPGASADAPKADAPAKKESKKAKKAKKHAKKKAAESAPQQ